MAKSRAVKEYRNRAWVEARLALQIVGRKAPRWVSADVRVTWYLPDLRRRDPDGLMSMLKSAFDGLTDAGVWTDDDKLVIHPATMALDRKAPRVVLTISEATNERD